MELEEKTVTIADDFDPDKILERVVSFSLRAASALPQAAGRRNLRCAL